MKELMEIEVTYNVEYLCHYVKLNWGSIAVAFSVDNADYRGYTTFGFTNFGADAVSFYAVDKNDFKELAIRLTHEEAATLYDALKALSKDLKINYPENLECFVVGRERNANKRDNK